MMDSFKHMDVSYDLKDILMTMELSAVWNPLSEMDPSKF